MQKKLTITVDQDIYDGLYKTIGPRKIGRFVQEVVRPFVIRPDLDTAYAEMAQDEKRERAAREWAEATLKDLSDETA
jgi:siroheme synthase (precorrin-2 oxidase/ferrochelatase)